MAYFEKYFIKNSNKNMYVWKSNDLYWTELTTSLGMVQILIYAKEAEASPKELIQHYDPTDLYKRKAQKVNCAKVRLPVWQKVASMLNWKCSKLQMWNVTKIANSSQYVCRDIIIKTKNNNFNILIRPITFQMCDDMLRNDNKKKIKSRVNSQISS